MNSYLAQPFIFIVQTTLGLYCTIAMLRFLLQIVRADFYNPISQFIITVTKLPLWYLRQIIPGIGGMDTASLVLAWLIKTCELFLIILLLGGGINMIGAAFLWAIPQLIELGLNIFLVAILIEVIFSWINYPGMNNPAANIAYNLSEPVVKQVRWLLPDMAGIDFSPMLASMILMLIQMLLIPPLKTLTGSPF